MQRLLGEIRRFDSMFSLIQKGEKVAIGLSGGKDSLALLHLLNGYREIKAFELVAFHVSPNDNFPTNELQTMCDALSVPFHSRKSHLFERLFSGEYKNPCAMCARERRGILVQTAKEEGCTSLALGHHLDDALETFLMSLLKEGRCFTLKPYSFMERGGIRLIRPLLSIPEQSLIAFVNRKNLKPVKNPCPIDKKTTREEMKQLLLTLQNLYPDIRQKLTSALYKENFFVKEGSHAGENRNSD